MQTNSGHPALTKYDSIILASKSPRRLDILRGHGIEPILIPCDVDETLPAETDYIDAVRLLSERKALAATSLPALENIRGRALLIASDTVVYTMHFACFHHSGIPCTLWRAE